MKRRQSKLSTDDVTRRAFLHGTAGGAVLGGLAGCARPSLPAAATGSDARRGTADGRRPPDAPPCPTRYPLFRAAGGHRALGRQHGMQAADRIAGHLELIMQTLGFSRRRMRERAEAFVPLFEAHCPHLLEELQGLAEGARISRADALAVNIRGALARVSDEGCTTYVIGPQGTTSGGVLIGQNADTFPKIIELAYVLHLEPQNKPAVLMWTYGGMIGYHGLNSLGVAQFAADLGTGGPQPRFGLPHYPVKRMMLECARIDEIVALLDRIPLCVNGNYVLCDGSGQILDIEATTAGPALITDEGAGFIAHTNHFIGREYATPDNHARCMADSFPRLARMNAMIRSRFGTLTVADMQVLLSDRTDHPTGICRHRRSDAMRDGIERAGETVASIVAEPASRRMDVALGNADTRTFVRYAMDA